MPPRLSARRDVADVADVAGDPEASHERHTWWVLAASAAVGFCLGALVYPMWTDNVESAQVQAGLVEYRRGDVMYVYHTSAYSIVIQLAALLLRAGVPEWTLSVLFSGLQAALSCSALALFTLAVSRSATTALLVPVLLLRFRPAIPDWPAVNLAVFHGHHYPNLFPNHTSLYGIVGLFWIVLVFSLFGLRKVRTASVLFGLMPAIHIGLAPACAAGALAAAWFSRSWLRPWWPTVIRYAALGAGISVVTAAWHVLYHWDPLLNVPARDVDRVATAFMREWDDHSAPIGVSGRTWLGFFESELYTLFLSVSLLTYLRRYLLDSTRVLVIAVMGITIAAMAYTVLANVFPGLVGWRIAGLLITRWLNLSSFAFPVLALGLLGRLAFRERDGLAAAALALAAGIVLTGYTLSITGAASIAAARPQPIDSLRAYAFPLATIVPCCLLAWLHERRWNVSYPPLLTVPAIVLAALAVVGSLRSDHFSRIVADRVRGTDPFSKVLGELRGRQGLLAVADGLWNVGRIQLRTRRPLVIDPTQLNLVLKVPAVGPQMEHIVQRLYDLDDFESGAPKLDRRWPGQPPEFWQAIRREFGVTEILVPGGVALQLPKLGGDEFLSAYAIPPP